MTAKLSEQARLTARAKRARHDAGVSQFRPGMPWWYWPHRDLFTPNGGCPFAEGDHFYLAIADRRPIYCNEPYTFGESDSGGRPLTDELALAGQDARFREHYAPLLAKGWRLAVTREGAVHYPGFTALVQLAPPPMSDERWIAELQAVASWRGFRENPAAAGAIRRRICEMSDPSLPFRITRSSRSPRVGGER
jgi:hypothetical protein